MATDIIPCDVCNANDSVLIPEAAYYNDGTEIHVCKQCGFVYTPYRRSAQEIADIWSHKIYGLADGDGNCRGELGIGPMETYSALTPFVKARHAFVLEFISQNIGLTDVNLCDIGAGQGEFLETARREYGSIVFGIEPSADNCERMKTRGIECFQGIVEDYEFLRNQEFDIATIVWTLENCHSSRNMVNAAYEILGDGGCLVVATGSRILVPFKKPLQYFFNPKLPQDTHPFFFSANSLRRLLGSSGFEVIHVNRFVDSDYLVMIGRKSKNIIPRKYQGDDYRDVLHFFERWHIETSRYFTDDASLSDWI